MSRPAVPDLRAGLTHWQTLDGRPLIELPPKEISVVKLEFTPEEREIYHMVRNAGFESECSCAERIWQVEAKSQAIFNRFLRTGTVLK